jgi:hypothetical protein
VDPAGQRPTEEHGVTPCFVTTGFFVLGRCGRQAVMPCANCGREVCETHIDGNGLCPECAAGSDYENGDSGDSYSSSWTEDYRREYYEDSGNEYQDQGWYSSFNEYDRTPFDPNAAGDPDYGPDDEHDYVDS